MKKLFTLLMILAVASIGYAQVAKVSKNDVKFQKAEMFKAPRVPSEAAFENVQNGSTMLRVEGTEVEQTYYDWQSNSGTINRTQVWDNGKVDFAFTVAKTSNYSDRGTGIITYDSNTGEWSCLGGRAEAEKTGFGSIARYGENGLVIAAHTADECHVYVVEDRESITANSLAPTSILENTYAPTWPAVMTSGPNRDIIHVVATSYDGSPTLPGMEGVVTPTIYFRSTDGGQTWDRENVILPYMTKEYSLAWSSNECFWMETTEDNRLTLIINNGSCDQFALYSYDDGETWEKLPFYYHPAADYTTIADGDTIAYWYPRYVSAVWGQNNKLKVAYEWNHRYVHNNGFENSYLPGYGGVSFWAEDLPYVEYGAGVSAIPGNLTPGEPFVMDTAYLNQDIYGSMWWWSDANHEMVPECMGYLTPLHDDGTVEDYNECESWNFSYSSDGYNMSNHGTYNQGPVAFPVLVQVPGSDDLVAVWSELDENCTSATDNLFYYHLFANYSPDGGMTWGNMVALCGGEDYWMYEDSEMIWPQAAIIGDELIVAAQVDHFPGSFVQQNDADGSDNYYCGYVFSLTDLFGPNVSVPEVSHNTKMTVSPNPASTRLSVNLNQNSEIVIYSITGQVVSRVKGHVGANSIDVSSLSSGIYFVNAGTDTQKFVVK